MNDLCRAVSLILIRSIHAREGNRPAIRTMSTDVRMGSFRIPDTAGEFRKRFIWRAVGVIVWETQVLVSGK